MKIALVVHDLHEHGGHSLYTKILADSLSSRHDVTVFANTCERPPNSRWASYHVRAWRRNALASVQTFPFGLKALTSKLNTYDVLHTQGYCGGHPNVVTAHICVAAYLESLLSINVRNRASLRLMAAAEARFYRNYQGQVIAISKKIEHELRKFYGVRSEITVIPHGVDAPRFGGDLRERNRSVVRKELGLSAEQTVALYVGDLIKSHTSLKALTHAAPEIQFLILSHSSKYRWSCPNVHFLGPTNFPQRYYAAADAFVFPTTYDAFGMVILEAMASGLPVFTSNRAGAAELIRSGHDGFVSSLEEWVEATREGLRNKDLLKAVGLAAEQTARLHSWEKVIQKTERIYYGLETTGRVLPANPSIEDRVDIPMLNR